MSEQRNFFINTARTVELGSAAWELAQDSGLTDRSGSERRWISRLKDGTTLCLGPHG